MTNKTPEELIHGLIDGELTADEQVRAEQLLAERADLRQLHDDLRTLQTSLGSMPRHRAPVDLQAGVLARLEQTPRTAQAKPAAIDQPALLRFPRGLRPWIWPAAALAAALVMMITNRDKQGELPEVADARRPAAPEASIGPAPDRGGQHDESLDTDFTHGSDTFQDAPETSELAKSAERRAGSGGLGGGAGGIDSNGPANSVRDGLGTSVSGKSAASRRLDAKDDKNRAAPAEGSSQLSGGVLSESDAQRFAKSPADQPARGTQFGVDGASATARSNFSFDQEGESDGMAAGQDLVVTCYFSSELAGKQALNEVLGREHFFYQTPHLNLAQAKEDQKRNEQRQALDYDDVINGTIAGQKKDQRGAEAERVVNAEASWPQVQQALEELYRRPDVTSLHVAPSSAAPARQLVREFNRGRLPVDSLSVDGQLHSSSVNQPTASGPQGGSERFLELRDKEARAQPKGEASGGDVNRRSRAREKQHKSLAKKQAPFTLGEAEGTAPSAPKSKLEPPASNAAAAAKPESVEPAATELGGRVGQPSTISAPTARPSAPALTNSSGARQSAATSPGTARASRDADAKLAEREELREEDAQRKKSGKRKREAAGGVRPGSAGSDKPQEPVAGQGSAIHSRQTAETTAGGEASARQQAAATDRVRVQLRLRVAPPDAAPNAAADVKPAEPAR